MHIGSEFDNASLNPSEKENGNARAEGLEDGISARSYTYTPEGWKKIKNDIWELARQARDEQVFIPDRKTEEWAQSVFEDTDYHSTRVLLMQKDKVIGFSLAYPLGFSLTTAQIQTTIIAKEYRRKGHIGVLMEEMEQALRDKGFKETWRASPVANGYADAIRRHYGERIVRSSFVGQSTECFRIKL